MSVAATLPPLPGLPPLPPLPVPAAPARASRRERVGQQYTHRVDPFWDGVWTIASGAVWSTASTDRSAAAAGRVKASSMPDSIDQARQVLYDCKPKDLAKLIAVAGALDSWGLMNAGQLEHLTGYRNLHEWRSQRAMRALYGLGMMDIGATVSPTSGVRPGRSELMFRAGAKGGFRKHLWDVLTDTELLSIDGGVVDAPRIGYHDRHNTLSVELGLRAAELIPGIGAVYGEKWSSSQMMVPSDYRKATGFTPGARHQPARGDGALVRADGYRIVLETTANSSPSFRTKVRRWADVLHRHPADRLPLFVLFVVAPHPGRDGVVPRAQIRKIKQDIADELKVFLPTGPDAPAARIGVVGWEDFFPASHVLSEDFHRLRVQVPQRRWGTVDLVDYAPVQDPDAVAAVDNAALLGGSPWWLRVGEHSHLLGGSPVDRLSGGVFPVPPHRYTGGEPAPFTRGKTPSRVQVVGLADPDNPTESKKAR